MEEKMTHDKYKAALDAFDNGYWTDEQEKAIRSALQLAQEAEQMRDDLRFLWKCVERAKWNPKIFGKPETAIENMALYPNAPWNNKDAWDWDTSHKEYDDEIKNYVAEAEQMRKERDELARAVIDIWEEYVSAADCMTALPCTLKQIELAKKVSEENGNAE